MAATPANPAGATGTITSLDAAGSGTPDLNIPNITLLEVIGRGGFGVVYRGHQRNLDRYVAVKVINVDADEDVVLRRVQREMQAMGRLSAYNTIVTVYDAGVLPGQAYLVMRYLPGGTVEDRMANGPLGYRFAVSAASRVASALASAHSHDIIHGDVKPPNVLLAADGEAFLGDFGVARLVDEKNTQAFLTPGYAAPEVLHGEMTPQTDVWALGATAYAFLTGAPPKPQGGAPLPAVVLRELETRQVPASLAQLIATTFAMDPARRPDSSLLAAQLLRAAETSDTPGPAARPAAPASQARPAHQPVAPPPAHGVRPTGSPQPVAPGYPSYGQFAPTAQQPVYPSQYVPAQYVPAQYVPAQYVPAQNVQTGQTGSSTIAGAAPTARRRFRPGVAGVLGALLLVAGAATLAYLVTSGAFRSSNTGSGSLGSGGSGGSSGSVDSSSPVVRLANLGEFAAPSREVVTSVAEIDGRLVAAGIRVPAAQLGTDEVDYGLWSSVDGSDWQRSSGDGLDIPGVQMFHDVANIDGQLFAVGESKRQVDAGATIFRSADGLNWTKVEFDAVVFDGGGDQIAFGVAGRNGRVVVVGADGSGDGVDAVAWVSDDGGTTWTKVAGEALGGPGDQYARSIVSTPDGFVAVGVEGTSEAASDFAVWRSPDGAEWERVSLGPVAAGKGELNAVAFSDGALVAVGSEGGSDGDRNALDGVILVSLDGGASWERRAADRLTGAVPQMLSGVASVGDGFVAVGYGLPVDGSACVSDTCVDASIFRSSNGKDWEPVGPDAVALGGASQQWARDAVVLGERTFVVGFDAATGNGDGIVWLLSPN